MRASDYLKEIIWEGPIYQLNLQNCRCPKLWAVRASRDERLRVLSRKFLKTLRRADENSQRAATMTFTGKKSHQREKGMGSWGLRVSRLCFGSILNLEMS